MFNPIFTFKQQKRNFQDDSPHYVPSIKKTRIWNAGVDETQQSNIDVDPTDTSLMQNEPTNFRVIDKPEYFPNLYIDLNDAFENDMMDQTKFTYMPDLNAVQNPHYYEYNKLLFELYLERIRRSKSQNQLSSQPSL